MIYYKEEKKKLVIPSGFVMIPIECDEAIEQAREQGYQEGFADGSSATCDTEEGTYSLTDDFDGEETVFPSEGKTGFNKIVIVDDGYGDAKYDEGYADGLADCSGSTDCSSAITEAFNSGYTEGYNQGQADCPECSGGTCNLEAGVLNLLGDGPTWSMSPSVGYDGWNSLTVNDMGYGDGKYNEGYEAGLEACSGGTCNLENGRVELGREWDGDDTIYPSQGYDGFGSIQITDNGYGDEKYQRGYTEGYNDGQGGGCNLQEKSVNQNTNLVTYNPDAGYDGMRTISVDATGVYSNGHTDGQNYARSLMVSSAFTENGTYTRAEGWNSITVNVQQSDCSSAITEAYESGVTVGYYDSSKVAYFNTPAWIETTNPQFLEVGDILDMVFVTGEMGGTLHLLGNLNSGYTETEYVGGPGIAIDYPNAGGLRITMFNADGFRHMWSPFYSVSPTICRFSGDTYHLIFKTTLPDSYGRMYMQVTLINESRFNDVYSASATGETIHFSSGATNPFVINGVYDENSGLYGEMNSELKIKSLKVYKPVGPHIANPDLNRLSANLLYKDGQFFDVASGNEYGAYIYDNGETVPYYLPSADDELYTIW